MASSLSAARTLPADMYAGTLVGRAWIPGQSGMPDGPCVVALRGDGVYDISAAAPTMTSAMTDVLETRLASPGTEPDFEFILPSPPRAAEAPAPVVAAPFVELIPQGPDEPAVDKLVRELEYAYPRFVPQLLALDHAVDEAARESSLALAGRRIGGWVFEREYALDDGLDLRLGLRRVQGARISGSSGSVVIARCISFCAETPSISAWCTFV